MFCPAVSESEPGNAPGTWYVWTRGDAKCEGSSVPFQDVMSTVSRSMAALDDARGTHREQFDRCKKASVELRRLLTEVYPKWTHRPSWSMAMQDSQEAYVYGLYNYARAKTSELMARANMSTATKRVLAACMLNAAHQKLVASQLLGMETIADDGWKNLVEHHLLYSKHFVEKYDKTDSGIGAACAHAARALQIAESNGVDPAEASAALENARSRNFVFEREHLADPMSLRII